MEDLSALLRGWNNISFDVKKVIGKKKFKFQIID